jgi:hypothetical protein
MSPVGRPRKILIPFLQWTKTCHDDIDRQIPATTRNCGDTDILSQKKPTVCWLRFTLTLIRLLLMVRDIIDCFMRRTSVIYATTYHVNRTSDWQEQQFFTVYNVPLTAQISPRRLTLPSSCYGGDPNHINHAFHTSVGSSWHSPRTWLAQVQTLMTRFT